MLYALCATSYRLWFQYVWNARKQPKFDGPAALQKPAAILDFVTGQKWRNSTLRTVHVCHRVKFGDCTTNGGRVIVVLFFENGGRHHRFCCSPKVTSGRCGLSMATSTQNLVKISQTAADLWRFSFFKMAAGRAAILDFVTGQKWRHGTFRTVHVYRRAKLFWWQQGRQFQGERGDVPPKFVLGDTSCTVPPKVEWRHRPL